MKIHEKYIRRCIQIAKNGLGSTAPNPMVGCVIVRNERIIGEGYTSKYGGAHAEVNAIASVSDKQLLKTSVLYVTLEPCSHYGKTPPCSDAIIAYGIPKVVIGCLDDNPQVAGKGVAKLMQAGCDVQIGVMEAECRLHHKRFFTFHNKKRPYIILKWAQTKNGYIAPKAKSKQEPVWISNSLSRQLTHQWRADEQAILVGTNTVLDDNPSLTVRDWTGINPIRVVLDKDGKLPPDADIFNDEAKTIVITGKNATTGFGIDWKSSETIAQQICQVLHTQQITSILIEGGATTLQTFINENLWDEARIFTGDIEFEDGLMAPHFQGKLISETKIDTDTLRIYAQN